VVVLVIVLFLSTVTGVVAAQSIQGTSGTIVVEEGETVSSVDALAGTIVIRGTVTGAVSGAAGDVRIDGEVRGGVTAGSGNVQVTETARIGGDGSVGAGYVRTDGRIDGDVRAGAETIVIGPNAEVGGEFRYDADSFTQDPAAAVVGGVVEDGLDVRHLLTHSLRVLRDARRRVVW